MNEFLRPDEVRAILRIGRSKLYEMIAHGELPVVRIGRAIRIPRDELERWVAEHITGWESGRAA
jgi:excisionase family DNA binding protein